MYFALAVIRQSPPESTGRSTTSALFATSVRVTKSGIPGNVQVSGVIRHHATICLYIAQREDVLLLGPPGTGKSHLAQAIGRAAILQAYRVVYLTPSKAM